MDKTALVARRLAAVLSACALLALIALSCPCV
jgi:hypothetical protein